MYMYVCDLHTQMCLEAVHVRGGACKGQRKALVIVPKKLSTSFLPFSLTQDL